MRFDLLSADIIQIFFFYITGGAAVFSDSKYEPIRIELGIPARTNFSPKILANLQQAIDILEKTISVLTYNDSSITWTQFSQCTKEKKYYFGYKAQKNEKHKSIARGAMLEDSNFLLLLNRDPYKCNRNRETLARAKPCYLDQKGYRHLAGILTICDNKDGRWDEFTAKTDLFRHEIIHALGFGLLVPPQHSAAIAPEDVISKWRTPLTVQGARRSFMDFAHNAVDLMFQEVAGAHFGCKYLEGIETDNEQKHHLNEYIYGNELMTPILSQHGNYFTSISATILEDTHFGAEKWYQVNRSIIAQEEKHYWYGRRWGCTFARKSCYEYINEKLRNELSTFPFCDPNGGNRMKVLTSPGHCNKYRCGYGVKLSKMDSFEADDTGIMLNSDGRTNRGTSPSHSTHRFCPFVEELSFDTAPIHIADNFTVTECQFKH